MYGDERRLRDYLTAKESDRRELLLVVETSELLRQGARRQGRTRQAELLAEARNQVQAQLRRGQRRAFRGEVSVDLAIFAQGLPGVPSAPKSVKRYLDALTGLAYVDDRQVAHLSVSRFADDHPVLKRFEGAVENNSEPAGAIVFITMKPLRLYVADYDRALDADIETWSTLDQDDHDGWSEPDEEELRELRRERRLDEVEGRWMAGAPAETLDVLRRFRDEREAQLLGKAIVDQRPGRRDRPGPLTDLEAVARRIGLPPPGEPDAWELPGQFWLDIPPELSGRPRWASIVREQMAEHRGRWRVLPRQFERPLALDIAACGTGENTRDIDNLAHGVLTAFEELYCGGHRGTVVAYRAYRRQTRRTGVRVQVLDDQTLHTLEDRIDKAREDTLRAGPTRDR